MNINSFNTDAEGPDKKSAISKSRFFFMVMGDKPIIPPKFHHEIDNYFIRNSILMTTCDFQACMVARVGVDIENTASMKIIRMLMPYVVQPSFVFIKESRLLKYVLVDN